MPEQNYFSASELKTFIVTENDESLKCFHLNTRSARNKTVELGLLFDEFCFEFDIIMLSETWYADQSCAFELPTHHGYFLNRTSGRGGGVSLLMNKSFRSEMLGEYSCTNDDYEVLSLLVDSNIASVFYRPPGGNLAAFFAFLDSYFSFANDNRYSIIAGGDFNINMLADTPTSRQMNLVISSNGCTNLITSPTRITSESSTLLDLLITNYDSARTKSGVICTDISDHLGVFMCVTKVIKNKKIQESVSFQNITTSSLSEFRHKLAAFDWSEVTQKEDVDGAYNLFLEHFQQLYKLCFPYKSVRFSKKNRKPWVTSELINKINKKNYLFKKFVKTKDSESLRAFKSFRNRLTKELRNARSRYFQNYFLSTSHRADITWKKLNNVLNLSPESKPIERICLGNVELTKRRLADAFNDFFVSLARDNPDENACVYIEHDNSSSLFLHPVVDTEVTQTFLSLKNSSSCDADDFQISPIKYVVDIISPCLTHIFNLCFLCGKFPKKMQIAKVTVLYKKGDRNDLGNYRPISILSVLSKGFEKLLLNRMVHFSDKYSLITPSQFGFRKQLSTELALLEQKDYIFQTFEDKKIALGVFVDFTKAFDHLNHDLLIKKLMKYGFRGKVAALIESYLAHRQQYVYINGYSSDIKPIASGVPQGSILGPFLFNLYVNDIVNINKNIKYVIYADDTSLFFTGYCFHDLVISANKTLKDLVSWSQDNALKINVSKTKAILFHSRNKSINITCDIILNSTKVDILSSFKTLGVIFSESMSWDEHVHYILSKLARVVGLLYRHRSIFPTNVKLMLYHSLFLAHINYCHLVWGNTTQTNIHKIFMLQKKIIRNICNVPYDHPSKPLFENMNLMQVSSFYKYRLCRTYKSHEQTNVANLIQLASLTPKVTTYLTRSVENWRVPTYRTTYGQQMISYTLPSLLNYLSVANVQLSTTSNKGLRLFFSNSDV